MEFIDTFDENYVFQCVASIDDVHQKGLWHQTVAFWIFNIEEQCIYLQLRGEKNRVGPNTFDASSGGHLSSGEAPQDGVRELKEELGLAVDEKQCQYFKKYKNIVHLPNYLNHEFCHIYFVETKKNLSDFVLQKGEVCNVFKLHIKDIDFLLAGQDVQIVSHSETRTINITKMCAYQERIKNGYYQEVLTAIKNIILKSI